MRWEQYNDNCPWCRPCLIDKKTRRPLPDNHPTMRIMLRVWNEASRAERAAYHRFMCQHSRLRSDVTAVDLICARVRQARREQVLS